jgi:uncharacterized membrane protein
MADRTAKSISLRSLGWLLSLSGVVGIVSSVIITLDKLNLLANPDFVPACSLNPVMDCGVVIRSAQAAIFGLPNPILSLIGFTAVTVIGVSLLAGAKFPAWYWRLFNLGGLLGTIFVHWLIYQSVYSIQALCIWCMVAWAVTIPIFWYTTLYNLAAGNLPTPKRLAGVVNFAQTNKHGIPLVWYTAVTVLIINHFWYFFRTVI